MEIRPAKTIRPRSLRFERLWGAENDTPEGDRLDVLMILVDAYETQHHPIYPPARPYYTVRAAVEETVITSLWVDIMGFGQRGASGKKENIGADYSQILRQPEGTPGAQ